VIRLSRSASSFTAAARASRCEASLRSNFVSADQRRRKPATKSTTRLSCRLKGFEPLAPSCLEIAREKEWALGGTRLAVEGAGLAPEDS